MPSLIVALASNNAIGFQQQLLWKISEDMRYFKRVTSGHCLIMGRKTFESIGRPLPDRRNIVISRNLKNPPIEGIEIAGSLMQAITMASQSDRPCEIFVIGGAEIYRQTLPIADKLYITHIKAPAPEADTFFPNIDWRQWKEVSRYDYAHGVAFPHPFSFVVYAPALSQSNYNVNPYIDIYS